MEYATSCRCFCLNLPRNCKQNQKTKQSSMEFTAQQIADYVGGKVEGNPAASVSTFAKIEEGAKGALSFFYDPKYEPYLYQTQSSVVLVPESFQLSKPVQLTLVRVANPREAIARLLALYESMKPRHKGISEQAYISPSAKIGEDVYVAPFAYIGDNAVVGSDCILYANSTVYHDCRVGNSCILHSGCVIGADGFGFTPSADGYDKIPQIGIAILEDDVEIGANACVDRAVMGATIIRKGVKIDNLVQIGHNVEVDSHTVLCAQVGIAGSTKVGQWCTFTGQVGVAGHATIADHTIAGAQSGIAGSVRKPGQTLLGAPAIDAKQFSRASVAFKNGPAMMQQIRELQKEVADLKAQLSK